MRIKCEPLRFGCPILQMCVWPESAQRLETTAVIVSVDEVVEVGGLLGVSERTQLPMVAALTPDASHTPYDGANMQPGQPRGDVIRLGRQHIKSGRLNFGQDRPESISESSSPQLHAAINAMPPHDHLCLLVTEQGKPSTPTGSGTWFRDQCDGAGRHYCSAHEL